jgi:cobalt-zinc-cadmium efflux system membrane fusion protein
MRRLIAGVGTTFLLAATTIVGVGCDQPENVPPVAETAVAEDYGLYCREHGVPEKFCTLCHPELSERLLLCPEHGNIPEDICTLCHPEVEPKYDLVMCPQGHGLPEHFCVECGKASEQEPSA